MEIKEIKEQEMENFLRKNCHKICYTPIWQEFITKTFSNVSPINIGVVNQNEILSIIPIFLIKNVFFGNRIISTAFFDTGGIIGDRSYTKDVIEYISKKYSKFENLEIREHRKEHIDILSKIKGATHTRENSLFILELKDIDSTWKELNKKRRNSIRMAQKQAMIVRDIKESDLNKVYDLYVKNMRRLGSPGLPKKFLLYFLKDLVMKGYGKIIGAFKEGRIICCIAAYTYDKEVTVFLGVSDYGYQMYKPNDLLYWNLIEWAIENKYKKFNFGRSLKGSGQAKFKKKWNAKEYDLFSIYHPIKEKKIITISHENRFFTLCSKVWKNIPIPICKIIGPKLREGMGI